MRQGGNPSIPRIVPFNQLGPPGQPPGERLDTPLKVDQEEEKKRQQFSVGSRGNDETFQEIYDQNQQHRYPGREGQRRQQRTESIRDSSRQIIYNELIEPLIGQPDLGHLAKEKSKPLGLNAFVLDKDKKVKIAPSGSQKEMSKADYAKKLKSIKRTEGDS